MTTDTTSQIGLIGLGVMGQNLARNIRRNGYSITVYDREPEVLNRFVSEHNEISAAGSPQEFVRALERPRKIVLLVQAGDAVDWTINLIKPFLEADDIIIDSGNSFFKDTDKREQQLKKDGVFLIGSGTSGGEKGALLGPSLMPGGDNGAYVSIRPIWEAIAAKVDDGPCVTYIGPGGSGHFVKMVHNGIEYGDMQLIAEVYDLLRNVVQLEPTEIADIFEQWNEGELESYLVQITSRILRVIDQESGKPLVDLILDKAGQKGTGRWTGQAALELGVSIPTIDAAIVSRTMSSRKEARVSASQKIAGPSPIQFDGEKAAAVAAIQDALFASKVCSYAQGMDLFRAASERWSWNLNLSEIARIWQGGCIIRARLLKRIKEAYVRDAGLESLLLDADFSERIGKAQSGWRYIVGLAQKCGVPVLALSSSLAYFDLYRAARLPLNLTQAQRDFFGAHTYERLDKPELGFVHTDWEGPE
jgi:6-phosphogluconate dehydrogenase